MIEAPEALILSEQLNQTIKGKRISFVSAGYWGSPQHKELY